VNEELQKESGKAPLSKEDALEAFKRFNELQIECMGDLMRIS